MNQDAFYGLAARLFEQLTGDEHLFCSLGGESSDFVRLNHNRIRQAGAVRAAALGLNLIDGERQAEASCDLSGDPEADLARARQLLGRLRERIVHVPEDPYLNYCLEASTSERLVGEDPPDARAAVSELISAATGLDLVGIWASGEIAEGLASSIGHRHWHRSRSFNLDFSGYLEADKAVKASYSGLNWESAVLARKLDELRQGLEVMARPARVIAPGSYRAYLAPSAVAELMNMLAWGGFDLKSHRTRQTPLLKLVLGERVFDPRVTIREEQDRGLAAGFTGDGFIKPDRVTLIEAGRFGRCLVDARDAKEYGEPVNAAGGSPESVGLDPGELPAAEVLARLDTGLWIGNLWYCNWSDPNDCRVTGMTRFGTWWVEQGVIAAPVKVMRFDDSLYYLLGDRLEGLTYERELLMDAGTYEGRSTESALLPGVLVSGIELAL
ncbi:metallopeptidase TldD-related protein [uncultured Thiodictyon sp.]|uniref:TldD/PmbA family protein n=1 Tax=uncultured Thiodictyon sp. TaxID=1846217 RepID=UPI0025D383EC|nr:metallopeptidase TldD-related protein [uncultured Thiodictyon sp.]